MNHPSCLIDAVGSEATGRDWTETTVVINRQRDSVNAALLFIVRNAAS